MFRNRAEAGRRLAGSLGHLKGPDTVVLGLPRGGVPVAARVAAALGAPLDVLVVRKLGLPGRPEFAMGAIAGVGGTVEVVRNDSVLTRGLVSEEDFDAVYEQELDELNRRELLYRGDRAAEPILGRVVIVVDDGLATGSTMRAAVAAVRRQQPARLVVAVPVAPQETCEELAEEVDDVVCAWTPEPFLAVAQGYIDFRPTSDEVVIETLADAARATERKGRS